MKKRNKNTVFAKLSWIFGGVWILSILVFIVSLIVATNFFKNDAYTTGFGNSKYFMPFFVGSIGVGMASFLLAGCFFMIDLFAIEKRLAIKTERNGLVKDKKDNKHRDSKNLKYFLTGGVAILLLAVGLLNVRAMNLERAQKAQVAELLTETNTPTPTATETAKPTPKPKPIAVKTIDPDPIINCTITANCGGGTRQMKRSVCSKSTCCQIGNNWYIYSSNEKCDEDQKSQYSNDRVYCYDPNLKYSYYTTASSCSQIQSSYKYKLDYEITPFPSIEPYQPSQEYLDSINNLNNVVNATWAPTQVILPTSHCYANWDEYFNAHPEVAGSNVTVMNGTPPCD